MLTVIFLFFTAPTASHAVAKAALMANIIPQCQNGQSVVDESLASTYKGQDLASVLTVGNTASNNITLTGTGILTAVDVFPTVISAGTQGTHGTNGQYLMSTGTGLQWSVPLGGTLTWNQVVANANLISNI